MPLRDHFHPPLELKHSWDELHGMWPMTMVQRLFPVLPEAYVAGPGVHLGKAFEIDVSAYDEDAPAELPDAQNSTDNSGGIALATRTTPTPTLIIETDLLDRDEYEVRVYDAERQRTLVAAIEIVSPANKDRPVHRRAFVAKCLALLQKNVCVSIVDVVTVRRFNLYGDLLGQIDRSDPGLRTEPPHLYAVTLRGRKQAQKQPQLETWFYPLILGHPLPQLPIWLDTDLHVMLDLEASYEDACRVLRIA